MKAPRNLSAREKLLLITAVIVSASYLFVLFLKGPLMNRYFSLDSLIREKKAALAKFRWLLENKDAITKNYAGLSRDLQEALDTEAGGSVLALSWIEKAATSCKVRIIELRPEEPPSGAGPKSVYLKTEGSIESYFKFIDALERSLLSLAIKEVQLSAKPGASGLESLIIISDSKP